MCVDYWWCCSAQVLQDVPVALQRVQRKRKHAIAGCSSALVLQTVPLHAAFLRQRHCSDAECMVPTAASTTAASTILADNAAVSCMHFLDPVLSRLAESLVTPTVHSQQLMSYLWVFHGFDASTFLLNDVKTIMLEDGSLMFCLPQLGQGVSAETCVDKMMQVREQYNIKFTLSATCEASAGATGLQTNSTATGQHCSRAMQLYPPYTAP